MPIGSDRLTGLPDRNGGYALAGLHVAEAVLNRTPLAALWIDIDRFHTINHSFGHPGGDLLVSTLAKRLNQVVQQKGEIARMSGDEFIVLLPLATLEAAVDLCRTIQQVVSATVEIEGVALHPSVSVGIALMEPEEDPVQLLLRADRAKAAAKRHGGDCHCVSGEKLVSRGNQLAREELEIEAKLHTAMDSGGLALHYQPVIGTDARGVEAVEALMRCTVGGESIPPARLIAVAEKTGLVNRLGEWTLAEGAAFARRLLNAGLSIKVAINVSRAQLLGPNFIKALHGAILCANIPPQLLEIELTESLFLDTSAMVQNNLRGIREAGVGLAIDDFGTGYSSLAILKDVPATKLKLDRSFIVALPDDRKAVAVVRAVTHLGRELGLTVVAEGVETDAQRLCLEEIGVDAIQGYFYSPPLPQLLVQQWLQDRQFSFQLLSTP
jgi:diguanylate cyclase (GGDEF)-like protein